MSIASYVKDPDAVLDYGIDWSPWLVAGDTITAVSGSVTPSGSLAVDSSSHTNFGTTVWLSGGTAGVKYTVTTHITTDDGREDDRSITVAVKER